MEGEFSLLQCIAPLQSALRSCLEGTPLFDTSHPMRWAMSVAAHWALLSGATAGHAAHEQWTLDRLTDKALCRELRALRDEQQQQQQHEQQQQQRHQQRPVWGLAWLLLLLRELELRVLSPRLLATLEDLSALLRPLLSARLDTSADAESALALLLLRLAGEETAAPLMQRVAAMPRDVPEEQPAFVFVAALQKVVGVPLEEACDFLQEFDTRIKQLKFPPPALANADENDDAFLPFFKYGRVVVVLWGLAGCSQSERLRGEFCKRFLYLFEREGFWQSNSDHMGFWIAPLMWVALQLFFFRQSATTKLVNPEDLSVHNCIMVGAKETRLVCPLCGRNVVLESTACSVHRAVALFKQNASRDDVKRELAESFAVLRSRWSELDCVSFLDVLCAVTKMHRTVVTTVDDLNMNREHVPFDISTFELYSRWSLNKQERMERYRNPRLRIVSKIREIHVLHPDIRVLRRRLHDEMEKAAPAFAVVELANKGIVDCQKAIAGLMKSGKKMDPAAREEKIREKTEMLNTAREALEKAEANEVIVAVKRLQRQLEELEVNSGMRAAEQELANYNSALQVLRCSDVGKQGLQFEHECLSIIEEMFARPGIRILRGVKFRGISFPLRSTGEFDFLVVEEATGNVLQVVEMKRGAGSVRANLMKKLRTFRFCCGEGFETVYEGIKFHKKSFAALNPEGGGFTENMWFVTREPVSAGPGEDVFGMLLDSEEAFLMSMVEFCDLEINSPEYLRRSYEFVKEKFAITEEDVADYKEGTAAFIQSVQQGRVLRVQHLFDFTRLWVAVETQIVIEMEV